MTVRDLPSVDELVQSIAASFPGYPHSVLVSAARQTIDDCRQTILAGGNARRTDIADLLISRLESLDRPSLRRVINATGVILHTNLGRAPLPPFEAVHGYSNLEFDLNSGKRGRRDVHTAALLEQILGSPGIVVNNNAAAVFLALNELAAGYEVIVSRGELIEIGDGFRIPDIMAKSGAVLREVGTTNRTTIDDYRNAISDRTRLLMRVHPSNFRIQGFTAKPELSELTALGKERGIPVYEDLGSGCLTDLSAFGVDEPRAGDSLKAGADLISFSGDKLLGGPQAGILAGRADLVARLRRNALFRALRVDKLIYRGLETTLRHILLERWESIPALAMISISAEEIRRRAERVAEQLNASMIEGESVIGGGSTPEQRLPTWLVAIETADAVNLEKALRAGDPPVIARTKDDRLLFDLRTVLPEEEAELIKQIQLSALSEPECQRGLENSRSTRTGGIPDA